MHQLSRRELLHILGLSGVAASASGLLACTPQVTGSSVAPAGSAENMTLRVGYLPITDATPLLLAHAQGYYAQAGLDTQKPTLFRGWAQIAEAFQAKQVDVVHILMPMAVTMRFDQKVPVKVVAWNHTDGSALTVSNAVKDISELAGQTIAVPFWYSIHNAVLQLMFRRNNLKPITRGDASKNDGTVKLIVMAPADMPTALSNGAIAGYIVADPFNAVAEVNKIGRVLRFTGDVWLNHACCVVIMHEEDTVQRPKWAQAVVNSVVKAQVFARENRKEAARILSKDGGDYLPQPLPVIERALTHYDKSEYSASGAVKHADWQNNRIDFQPFPFPTYTQELVKLLKDTVVEGDASFLQSLDPAKAHEQLVNDRFVRESLNTVGAGKFGLPANLTRTEQIAV